MILLLVGILITSILIWGVLTKWKFFPAGTPPPPPPPSPDKYLVMDFNILNNKFKSPAGILAVMGDYVSTNIRSQKIYLKNNVAPTQDGKRYTIATTFLTEKLPLNLYAQDCPSFTIGIILDSELFMNSGIIRCGNTADSSSGDRYCQKDGVPCVSGQPKTCKPGVLCDENNPDYVDIQAGCGVNCSDSEFPCNTVQWCDKFDRNEVIKKYTDFEWGGWNGCVFKKPDDLYIQAAIAQKKEQIKNKNVNNYMETEWDGILDLDDKTEKLWLKSIIGIFHTSDPGYMCACWENGCTGKNCCNTDEDTSLECMKSNNIVSKCQLNSIQTVRDMVEEYNTKVSPQTGHLIKGWSIKNIKRSEFNGWSAPNYKVDLSKFMIEM